MNKRLNADSFFEQAVNITKAYAYDNVLIPQVNELKVENEKLKERVKFLENLIKEYTEKMLNNLK